MHIAPTTKNVIFHDTIEDIERCDVSNRQSDDTATNLRDFAKLLDWPQKYIM